MSIVWEQTAARRECESILDIRRTFMEKLFRSAFLAVVLLLGQTVPLGAVCNQANNHYWFLDRTLYDYSCNTQLLEVCEIDYCAHANGCSGYIEYCIYFAYFGIFPGCYDQNGCHTA